MSMTERASDDVGNKDSESGDDNSLSLLSRESLY